MSGRQQANEFSTLSDRLLKFSLSVVLYNHFAPIHMHYKLKINQYNISVYTCEIPAIKIPVGRYHTEIEN